MPEKKNQILSNQKTLYGQNKGKQAKCARKNIAQGKNSEIDGGKIFQATLQPGSGCGGIHKEDLKSKDMLIQVKSCRKRSMSLKFTDLKNLVENADKESVRTGRKIRAVMFIDITDFPIDVRRWVLIPLEDYKWQKKSQR